MPGDLKDDLENFLYNSLNEKEAEIIEAADSVDAYLFCKFQVKIGNFDYSDKLKLMSEKVDVLRKKFNYVDYFLKNLCDFENLEINY